MPSALTIRCSGFSVHSRRIRRRSKAHEIVLIDEYQDFNGLEAALLDLLEPSSSDARRRHWLREPEMLREVEVDVVVST